MGKYRQVYKVSVQNTLAYRGPILIYRLSTLLIVIIVAFVWLAADTAGTIGGFTKNSLITYYFISMVMTPFIAWYPVGSIKREINEGSLASSILPKPLNYFLYKFFQEFGWHTVSPIIGLIVSAAALILFGKYLVWDQNILQFGLFLVAVTFSAWLTFGISYCLGLLSFWFTEIEGITSILWMGIFIFGGQGIPISFFPDSIRPLVELIPFRYVFSVPLEIFTHRLNTGGLLVGFMMQITWLVVFWLLGKFLWHRGLKIYSSFGG